ncbi:hypothetical protein V8C34DRAFT_286304 [Trichoderma compactum]
MNRKPQPSSGRSCLRKMGIASGLVQPGDIVIWVRSSRRALLVRVVEGQEHSNNTKLRMFGTALTTEDVCGATPSSEGEFEQRWNSVKGERTTEVQIDAGTLFMLLD